MRASIRTLICGLFCCLVAVVVHAQQAVVATPSSACQNTSSETRVRIGDNHNILIGHVEIDCGDTKLYADQVEVFTDEDRTVATGNVVLSQASSRIAADRAEFNLKTKLGTFYNAWGMAPLGQQKSKTTSAVGPAATLAGGLFGSVSASTSGQTPTATTDTDVYFFGETIEKLGPRRYKITNGGFTTCVQPTPRWELHSNTVTLKLDNYTVLHNAVFRVKGVPMLYTPFLYYPTKRDDRATGILIPTYGATTLRGQSIHNAFFWAINRSQDATVMYDWFSQAGQGLGGEYRYNSAPGSDGTFRAYLLDQRELTSGTTTLPASRSYDYRGAANQTLPGGFHARTNVSYFSSFESMQTFNTNVYDASRNQRSFAGNVVGVVGDFSVNGTLNRSEYFYGTTNSAISGTWPRVALARSERPLLGSPIYVSFGGDYGRVLRDNRNGDVDQDWSLNRFDVSPQIRYPFKKWQWFTVNSTISWRDTYYSRSRSLATGDVIDEGLNRRFFEFQSQISGPVFARVWSTPQNGYAEKFKHSIEPFLTLNRTSSIDNFDRIVQLEGGDLIIGGATRYTYGVTNRFYAKRRQGALSQAREIATIDVSQSYYTDPRSAQYDYKYSTSFLGASPSNYSPIAVSGRVAPTDNFNATVRAEIDSHYLALRTITVAGSYSVNWLTTTAQWSKRAFIAGLAQFNDKSNLDQYLNASVSAHTKDNHIGTLYSMNYDVLRSNLLQQRITGFYNSQCCGVSFEYQVFNFNGLSLTIPGLSVAADHRFFMSFTLAGLGNFSPFNGALSGAPR